ncbi:MAG: 50S ribosome-binding GTPase [Candidatus Lokiarchaeota archaeon]|nr:50S ribosome-binding GTPase [Candidatus Lokiarchaeota archaeon]
MSSNEPTKMQQLVDAIGKRFLKEDQKFASVKEILEAPLTALKKVDQKTAKLLEEAAFVNRIVDLVDLDPTKPFESLMQGRGDVEDPIKFSMLKDNIINRLSEIISTELLRDIIVAARLISRAEKKQDFYIKAKKEQKIMFLGLDNAGKTAIINVLSGRINPSFLRRLKPTKKVARETITTKDFSIHIWDLGGQKEYRQSYLHNQEAYETFFLQTDMVVYVIDMQDMARLPESLAYLSQLLDAFKYVGENPFFLFFLHKSDPDIMEAVEFQMNIESVKDGLLDIMKKFDFDYDAYPTSIYYMYSREAKFTGFIKGVLDEQKDIEEKKKDPVKAMGEILDTAMNLTVNLANTMEEQFSKVAGVIGQLEARVARIEQALAGKYPELAAAPRPALAAAPAAAAPAGAAMPPLPPGVNPPPPMAAAPAAPQAVISSARVGPQHANIRSTMMDELKAIFAKKRLEGT